MQEGTVTLLLEMAERGRAAPAAAPALTVVGRVIEVGGGKVYVDSPPNCPGEEGLGVPATSEAERAYAAMLLVDGAVRITIEPVSAALAGQQPRDLAGRIRALIQEYAGRWADAEPRSIERRAATGVMDDLCRALDDVRTGTGRPLTWWIELFRHPSGSMDPTIRAHRSLAADELETIVRECAPAGDT
jgi:hypothetical protein